MKRGRINTETKPRKLRDAFIRLLPYVVLLSWTWFLYFPGIAHPFVYDDQFQILRNPNLQNLATTSIYFHDAVRFHQEYGPNSDAFYRPIFWTSFFADEKIWGLDSRGFHATNILIHALNGILIFLLFRRWLDPPLPLFAALLWLSLPIHTEVVAWISGRALSVATFFILVSVLAALNYAERRSARQFSLLILASSAALLSHEAAIVVPILAVLAAAYAGPAPDRRRNILYVLIGSGAPLCVYALVRIFVLHTAGPSIQAMSDIALQGPVTVAKYVWWTVHAPSMSMERSTELSNLTFRSSIYAGAWLTILGIGAISIWFRKSIPALTIGFIGAGVALLPFAQILPLYQSMAERYTYTASVGIVLAIVAFLAKSQAALRLPRCVVIFLLCVWIGISIVPLRARVRAWSSEQLLYTTSLRANPRSQVLYQNLGVLEEQAGKKDAAVDLYKQAIKMKPYYVTARKNLANLYLRDGKLPEAADQFKEILKYSPDELEARLNLGSILLVQGDANSAIELFTELVQQHPDSFEGHMDLGIALFSRKDPAARAHLERALQLKPTSPEAAFNLGVLEEESGHIDAARTLYQQALRYRPQYKQAASRLQELESNRGIVK